MSVLHFFYARQSHPELVSRQRNNQQSKNYSSICFFFHPFPEGRKKKDKKNKTRNLESRRSDFCLFDLASHVLLGKTSTIFQCVPSVAPENLLDFTRQPRSSSTPTTPSRVNPRRPSDRQVYGSSGPPVSTLIHSFPPFGRRRPLIRIPSVNNQPSVAISTFHSASLLLFIRATWPCW